MEPDAAIQINVNRLEGVRLHARALTAMLGAMRAGDLGAGVASQRLAHSLVSLNSAPAITEAAGQLSDASPEGQLAALERLVEVLSGVPWTDADAKGQLLVVSEDSEFSSAMVHALQRDGRRVLPVSEVPRQSWPGDDAEPALILVDGDIAKPSAHDLVLDLRGRYGINGPPVIVASSGGTGEAASEWFALGASAYLRKPVDRELLVATIAAQLHGNAERSQDSLIDVLTGLSNRRGFSEELERVLGAASRQQRPVSVAIIDLDHFKSVNDTYGHAAGDEVLRRVGEVIPPAMRTVDLLARWGGEEFVALFPETEQDSAAQVLERALGALRAETFKTEDGRTFNVTFSAGVAEADPDASVEEAVARADRLLYIAKTSGRNRVVVAQSQEAMAATSRAMDEAAQAERRQLTVMDIQLTGTNEEIELLTLDERSEFVRSYHSVTLKALNAFGGHVAQDLGTRLLVYFGYPFAHEDDAERAVRAGLTVIEAIESLSPDSRDEFETELNATIGVHTGPVVVYTTGGG